MSTSQTEVKQEFHKAESLDKPQYERPMSKRARKEDVFADRATMEEFLDKMHEAKATGQEWVETSPEVIKFYNKNGLGGARYFILEGIKVCEHGQSADIEEEMNTPMAERMHGKGEGKENQG